MKIVLVGPPGSGKGTQADLLSKKLGVPQVSTGDILRRAIADKTPLGLKVSDIIRQGKLVDDDTMFQLVQQRLSEADCANGFLLDGFPRTIGQAEALKASGIILDYAIKIEVPDEYLIDRLTGRRVHVPSGRVYHIKYNPPKVDGIDDVTQEPLVHRNDDIESTVRGRLALYHAETSPLVNWYIKQPVHHAVLIKIDGMGSVDEVNQRILDAINK